MKFIFGGIVAFVLSVGAALPAKAQGGQYACKVFFNAKTGAPALSAASTFLSARALQRRSQQGLSLNEQDRPVSPLFVDTVLQVSGGVFHLASRWGNYIVYLSPDTTALALLRQRAWVTGTEVVGAFPGGLHNIIPPAAGGEEGEALTPFPEAKTTGSAAYYGATWDQTNLVHGDALHDAGLRGSGMLIAVIDERFTGSESHPGLAAMRNSGRLVETYNFLLRDSADVFNGPSHGTQVLSLMAGFQPTSYVGAAPEAQYALYATEISGQDQPIELDNLVAAVERADSLGADVVNISLGYNYWNFPTGTGLLFEQLTGDSLFVSKALNIATQKGMLPVVSAGNEGGNSWDRILAPADADSALTVGSVASNGVPASTSGTGPNYAGRVKPDVAAMGVQASVYGTTGVFQGGGTSYAAPQIAGYAACLWGGNKTLSPGTIRRAITASASRAGNPDSKVGYGIPDFSKAIYAVGIETPPRISDEDYVRAFVGGAQNAIQIVAHLSQSQTAQLQLLDYTGKMVQQAPVQVGGTHSQTAWLLPAIPTAGLYLLRVQWAGGTETFKLLFP